jgi:hypothetical protein
LFVVVVVVVVMVVDVEGVGWGIGRGRAHVLPEEDYTVGKAVFLLDATLWPAYSRLLVFIKKNKRLQ